MPEVETNQPQAIPTTQKPLRKPTGQRKKKIFKTFVSLTLAAAILGGGGNTATAGAQIADSSIQLVLDDLVASIEKYYEK